MTKKSVQIIKVLCYGTVCYLMLFFLSKPFGILTCLTGRLITRIVSSCCEWQCTSGSTGGCMVWSITGFINRLTQAMGVTLLSQIAIHRHPRASGRALNSSLAIAARSLMKLGATVIKHGSHSAPLTACSPSCDCGYNTSSLKGYGLDDSCIWNWPALKLDMLQHPV